MSLFSKFRKNKQDAVSSQGDEDAPFYPRSQEPAEAAPSRAKKTRTRAASQVDPVLPEKKRARRRLVGALALVLAMVIVLPRVLDSQPKPLADDIAIQIPSKEKAQAAPLPVPASAALDPNETVVQPGAPAASGNAKSALASAENEAGDKTSKKDSKQEAKADIKPEAKPAAKPADASETKLAAKPESKPETKPAVKVPPAKSAEQKVAEHKAADHKDETARAQAILEGRTEEGGDKHAASAEAKHGKVIVQVAALAAHDKVAELQGKLSEAGIKSYTQKISTQNGERIRVRIGPFASKDEADRMRAKLQKLGINGTLVPA